MPLDPATKARLEGISTATVTTLLLKKGLRNVWMRGPLPFTASARGKRLIGPAFTLRFVPAREDLASPKAGPRRARRAPPSRTCRPAASPWRTRWA